MSLGAATLTKQRGWVGAGLRRLRPDRREHLVVVLAAVSGSVDAIGFVALGGAFTSVMTGNLVLTGVAVAHGDSRLLIRVFTAIVAFVVGCWAGARMSGELPVGSGGAPEKWPARVTRTLFSEWVLIALFSIVWWLSDGPVPADLQPVLLAINAAALGIQSAAVQRFGVPGLSTTYLTGTLTTLVVQLAHRRPLGALRLNAELLAALVAGGASGAALVLHARPAAPVLPLLGLLAVLLAGRRLHPHSPGGEGANGLERARVDR